MLHPSADEPMLLADPGGDRLKDLVVEAPRGACVTRFPRYSSEENPGPEQIVFAILTSPKFFTNGTKPRLRWAAWPPKKISRAQLSIWRATFLPM